MTQALGPILGRLVPLACLKIIRTNRKVRGFPYGSVGKESACNAGDPVSIPGSARFPGEGHGNPFQYSSLENSEYRETWVGPNPWGHKELDMTGQLI